MPCTTLKDLAACAALALMPGAAFSCADKIETYEQSQAGTAKSVARLDLALCLLNEEYADLYGAPFLTSFDKTGYYTLTTSLLPQIGTGVVPHAERSSGTQLIGRAGPKNCPCTDFGYGLTEVDEIDSAANRIEDFLRQYSPQGDLSAGQVLKDFQSHMERSNDGFLNFHKQLRPNALEGLLK